MPTKLSLITFTEYPGSTDILRSVFHEASASPREKVVLQLAHRPASFSKQ